MRGASIFLALALASCGNPGKTGDGGGKKTPADDALAAYESGDLARAESLAKETLARDANDMVALRLLGRICLYTNRLKEAAEHLSRVVDLITADPKAPPDFAAFSDLAWTFYRMDDYLRAGKMMRLLQDRVLAEKFDRLGQLVPYLARWDSEPAILSFATTDPLPAVRLRVNGQAGLFAIDSGAGEIVLDREFAKKARVHAVGIRTEQISGALQEGWVDEVTAGSVAVKNVPVQVRELPPFGRTVIDGQIGVNFLLHFTFTIDYKRSRLVLHRPTTPVTRAGTETAFLVAGDRYLIARGTVDGQSTYLHLHTGLAKVTVAPSYALLSLLWSAEKDEKKRPSDPTKWLVKEISMGPLSLKDPSQDPRAFLSGLDATFGFQVGGSLGHEAFKGRILTFMPERMRLTIE